MKSTLVLLFVTVILTGCVNLVPGTSREAEVIAQFGQPDDQRQLPDGSKALYFSRSPMGYENWRVTLGQNGTVSSVEQLLDAPHFARLKAGMTIDEVKRELGRPGEITKYARLSEEVLSWRYIENGTRFFFNAHFDASGRFKYSSRNEELIPTNDVDN